MSDIVGRTSIRYGRLLDLTHRFRIDKDNFAVRRNEIDLTVGTTQTYAQIGYLKLNRNVDPTIEDLARRRGASRRGTDLVPPLLVRFGAAVVDLTDKQRTRCSVADGWEPVRDRLGIQYEDDCLQIGLTWKRDYERIGTFRPGTPSAFTWH